MIDECFFFFFDEDIFHVNGSIQAFDETVNVVKYSNMDMDRSNLRSGFEEFEEFKSLILIFGVKLAALVYFD